MDALAKEIKFYTLSDGTQPFQEWLDSLRDQRIRKTVLKRMDRLRHGNYGECKSVGSGLLELRFLGLGIRVYFAEVGDVIVLILWGGGKNTPKDQTRDIEKARTYWEEFKKGLKKEAQHD